MATPLSVSFHTLGCKLNFSETSAIRRQFESAGYAIREFEEGADISVINTCSVTDFADRKCRKAVRLALSKNRDSKIVVIGCYAQLKPNEIANMDGVDLVLGAGEKFQILEYLERIDKSPGKGWVHAGDIHTVQDFAPAFSYGDRTRSFLKIQDGCNYLCTFCTIPQARGKSRSNSIENVLTMVDQIASKGIQEIVLTGVNIGDFRDPSQASNNDLIHLLRALEKQESVPRFRISSIEPNLCTDEIVDLVGSSKKFMPHFHMPLQSGSNAILGLMKRRYRREWYAMRVKKIKNLIPHASIGCDVIVGFPGETLAHFEETQQFLADLDIHYLHVFTYSERANTPAGTMNGAIPLEERRLRNEVLRNLSNSKESTFFLQFQNDVRPVLLEKSKKAGYWSGFTDNYLKVEVRHTPDYNVNQIHKVKLNRQYQDGSIDADFI